MKLFLLDNFNVTDDECASQLIRAKTEKRARQIANTQTCDEGKIWENKKLVSCIRIFVRGEEQIIITDVHTC